MIYLLLLAGLFMGWSLGTNDAANAFGTAVATRVVSYRTAVTMIAALVVVGAFTGGANNIDKVAELAASNQVIAAVDEVTDAIEDDEIETLRLKSGIKAAIIFMCAGLTVFAMSYLMLAFMDARNARIQAGLEEERIMYATIEEEAALREKKRKESHEEARRIVHDAQANDELRHAELISEANAENLCKRKAAKTDEIQRNEDESRLMEEQQERLAALLADNLLDHFPNMPEVLVARGLRLAVEQAVTTWEQNEDKPADPEIAEDTQKKTADLFAKRLAVADDVELLKIREEQRQLDEKWEQLASILAERLICPGA